MSAQTGTHKIALTAATTTAVGGVLKVLNPEGVDLIITRFIVDISTPATGTPTIDAGIDDGGDVSSDTLLDGVAIGTSTALIDPLRVAVDAPAASVPAVRWPAGHYLVATASASAAGLVGNAHIQYVRR